MDPFTYPIHIRFGDTDALGHVNNAVYMSYFESARLAYARFLLSGTRKHRIGRPKQQLGKIQKRLPLRQPFQGLTLDAR